MYFCDITDVNQVKELKQQILSDSYTKEQEELFYSIVDKWLHDFDRLPNVDEFPPNIGVDSFTQLKTRLKLKTLGNDYYTSLDLIKKYTGKEDELSIAQELNKLHKDYNFEVNIIDDEVLIKTEKRPSIVPKEIDPIPDMPIANRAMHNLVSRAQEMHGIKINEVTTREIATLPDFPGAATLRGFIRNGEIYINVDNATPDTKIHELMHLFMGGIRFENPKLYQDLLNIVLQDENIRYKMNQFRHRTEMDRAEEVLVEELGKFFAGRESTLSSMSNAQKYELDYNIRRLLDSILNGDFSNKIIDGNVLYKSTLEKVARIVNSREIFNNMTGTMSQAFVHRLLNNYKADLLKSGKLKEIC